MRFGLILYEYIKTESLVQQLKFGLHVTVYVTSIKHNIMDTLPKPPRHKIYHEPSTGFAFFCGLDFPVSGSNVFLLKILHCANIYTDSPRLKR